MFEHDNGATDTFSQYFDAQTCTISHYSHLFSQLKIHYKPPIAYSATISFRYKHLPYYKAYSSTSVTPA